MDEEKKKLIEEFSVFFETAYQFPPLISKIFVYLLVDIDQAGVTFDELVEAFNASKSSISNSLHYLTQLKYIDQTTKIDSRKRYYKLASNSLLLRLEQICETLEKEKSLSIKLKEYKRQQLKSKEHIQVKRSEIYIEHLDNAVLQLSKTITKLKSLK